MIYSKWQTHNMNNGCYPSSANFNDRKTINTINNLFTTSTCQKHCRLKYLSKLLTRKKNILCYAPIHQSKTMQCKFKKNAYDLVYIQNYSITCNTHWHIPSYVRPDERCLLPTGSFRCLLAKHSIPKSTAAQWQVTNSMFIVVSCAHLRLIIQV